MNESTILKPSWLSEVTDLGREILEKEKPYLTALSGVHGKDLDFALDRLNSAQRVLAAEFAEKRKKIDAKWHKSNE